MGSVRVHGRGTLFLDFRYQGRRCREYTALNDSAANRQRLQKVLLKIEQQIKGGTFDYATAFPASAGQPVTSRAPAAASASSARTLRTERPNSPVFRAFPVRRIGTTR